MKVGRVVFDDGDVSTSEGEEGFRGANALVVNINPKNAKMDSG